MVKTIVSGNTVREFLIANPVEGVTVSTDRGRLSNKAVAAFHEKNPTMQYVAGTKDQTVVSLVLPKTVLGANRNGKAEVTVAEARALAGDKAGQRGILTPAAIEAAGVALAEQRAAAKVAKPKAKKAVKE